MTRCLIWVSAKYRRFIHWLDARGYPRVADVAWTAFFRLRRFLFE